MHVDLKHASMSIPEYVIIMMRSLNFVLANSLAGFNLIYQRQKICSDKRSKPSA